MAALLSPERLSDNRAFEREWTALRECVSPWGDKEQQDLSAVDWPRLLLLADEHGVLGQLAARPDDPDAPAIPPEIQGELAGAPAGAEFADASFDGRALSAARAFQPRWNSTAGHQGTCPGCAGLWRSITAQLW